MKKILICNARLVNEGQVRDADVLISGERIEKIADSIPAAEGMQVIDANGSYLMPGMIDDQVHFREPGLTNKGDLATESAAAAAGVTAALSNRNTFVPIPLPRVQPPPPQTQFSSSSNSLSVRV